MTLKDVIKEASFWTRQRDWHSDSRVVGRSILASDQSNHWQRQLERGELYLNPGQDKDAVSQATEALRLGLQRLIESPTLSEDSSEDHARARFILECLSRPMGDGWVRTRAEIAKIRNLPDRMEVFVADPHRYWPDEGAEDWPPEWDLHPMERYVRWTPARSRSPGLGDTYSWPGPCPGGTWPVFYRPFLGCVCCTNGMVFAVFGRGFWTCWPPRVAIAVRRDGGHEKIEVANLPNRLKRVWSVKPSPRDVLAVDMDRKLGRRVHREGNETRAARILAKLLEEKPRSPLKAVAAMVQASIGENWTLRDQLQAEELAGDVLAEMLGLPTEPEPTGKAVPPTGDREGRDPSVSHR